MGRVGAKAYDGHLVRDHLGPASRCLWGIHLSPPTWRRVSPSPDWSGSRWPAKVSAKSDKGGCRVSFPRFAAATRSSD